MINFIVELKAGSNTLILQENSFNIELNENGNIINLNVQNSIAEFIVIFNDPTFIMELPSSNFTFDLIAPINIENLSLQNNVKEFTVNLDNPSFSIEMASNPNVQLLSLLEVGPPGPPGLDAYQIAVNEGFVGTRQEWISSLKVIPDTNPQEILSLIDTVNTAIADSVHINKKQNLTTSQQNQARYNINAISMTDIDNTAIDFVATFKSRLL